MSKTVEAIRCLSHDTVSLFIRVLCFSSALIFAAFASSACRGDEQHGFAGQVAPLFQNFCVKCHGTDEEDTQLALHQISATMDAPLQLANWSKILTRLQLGDMPPADERQPPRDDRERAIRWIKAELDRAGGRADAGEAKLRQFAYGNLVDHESLFHSTLEVAIPAEPRLWRLSPSIYEQLVNDAGGDSRSIAQPFALGPGGGIKDYAAAFVVDEPAVTQLLRNAGEIVAAQTRDKQDKETNETVVFGNAPKQFRALVETQGGPTGGQIEEALHYQFDRVLQREPTADELAGFTALMRKNIRDAGAARGVRATLAAVLLLPEAVFRLELGQGPPDKHGRIMLSPRELAYAVAYALTDERPDGQLLKAADEGRLATRDDVRRELERLWQDPKTKKPRIPRFFREYFGYHRAPDVFKNDKDVKQYSGRFRAEILVNDTDQLIEWILKRDQNVLKELLTTNRSFVNYRVDSKKGPVLAHDKNHMELAYNVAIDEWTKDQPMELPREERAGILTQPSWLVAHSDNTHTHPILRGKWVRERLLGGTVPDLPITVDAQFPDAPEQTIRERLAITKDSYCWKCHQQMNSLGLPFEAYSHLGEFRKLEPVLDLQATAANVDSKGNPRGDVLREVEVDPSGVISRSGEQGLDCEVKSAVEMIHRLADSDRVRQVFVRHVFRYFMGRNERPGDGPTLIAADKAYVESGGSFKGLVISLLTSDSFLYRQLPSQVARQ